MESSDFERVVSVKLIGKSGHEMHCSALLERDPGFFCWNRISLIGNEGDKDAAVRLQREGLVEWYLHHNASSPFEGNDEEGSCTGGSALLRAITHYSGNNIAQYSVQKFADLDILEYRHNVSFLLINKTAAEYWFLQRPHNWNTYLQKRENLTYFSEWKFVESGLEFRLVSIGKLRSDRRTSKEVELIRLPGVQMRPHADVPIASFVEAADDLWFNLRIMITFRFRVYTTTLAEFRKAPGEYSEIWHPAAVEPRVSECSTGSRGGRKLWHRREAEPARTDGKILSQASRGSNQSIRWANL